MKIITKVILGLACCVLLASTASAQKKGAGRNTNFLTEGTFSNITTGEGGDMGGMQIYLTDSDGQVYVLVTIAEGVKAAPVLVKANVDVEKRKIQFTLPDESGDRKFSGVVKADGMSLTEIVATAASDGSKSSGNNGQFLKRLCQK